MIKELYQTTIKETTLNVTQSKIDAVMKKAITKSGCRVYDNGFIGVAGTLGEPTKETWEEAEANLKNQIPYPYALEKDKRRIRDLRSIQISDEDFIGDMEKLLSTIHKEFPDFVLYNKIKLIESKNSLKNDLGLDYVNYDRSILVELIVKHVDSLNIMDTFIALEKNYINTEEILKEARFILEGYRKIVELPKNKKMPVVICQFDLLSLFIKSLNSENLGLGTSIFCDKMGKKVFSEAFSLIQDCTKEKKHTAFFDMEGVVNPEDKTLLIQNGTLLSSYTDKKQAAAFSYPLTGAAGGDYDEVPSLSTTISLSAVPGEKTLKELLKGEPGIMVILASGGDYTTEGNYASPVQMAYLTDGECILGRLPEFNIAGNIYEMFGEDYLGVSSDNVITGEKAFVVRMEIN